MADKLTKIVHDLSTGKTEEIELTPAEIAEMDQRAAAFAEEQKQNEENAKAAEAAKESAIAKLSKLGLTADEIAALTK